MKHALTLLGSFVAFAFLWALTGFYGGLAGILVVLVLSWFVATHLPIWD